MCVSIILQVDSIDLEEAALNRILSTKEQDMPSLRILTVDGEFGVGYVVGEGQTISCQSDSVIGCLIVLLGVYYVMDINYPDMYSQLLGFLQQHIIKEPFTLKKGTKFINFADRIKKT